jgi:molecular chaperone HscB
VNNYFDLFDLPHKFTIHIDKLDEQYHKVQAEVHPDRFASANESDRRRAIQYSAMVNDAYETLKSPIKRAIYLLQEQGIEFNDEETTNLSAGFLMEQIELREKLEENKEKALKEIDARVLQAIKKLEDMFEDGNLEQVKRLVQELQFLIKLQD